MATDQITGPSNGVSLTSTAYSNPVTVANTGTVLGNGIYASGNYADDITWTIQNDGTIQATGAYGVSLATGGTVTNDSGGSIYGSVIGVYLQTDGSVLNQANGTISSAYLGVFAGGDSATVENAGTIAGSGGRAVYLDAMDTNRLIVDAGATFIGGVVANGNGVAANTLELSNNTGPGTISGIGDQFQNFQTVTIDSGATWDIGAITAAVTVENAGSIGTTSDTGVNLTAGGSVSNQAGGAIYGVDYGVHSDAAGTVTNDSGGTISGGRNGVYFDKNDMGANSVDNSGTIIGTNDAGVYIYNAGSVTNHSGGTISNGIALGSGSIDNSGLIAGTFGSGIYIFTDGYVSNAAHATISGAYGGIEFSSPSSQAADGTVVNAGSIGGGMGAGVSAYGSLQLTNESGGAITGGGSAGLDGAGVGMFGSLQLTNDAGGSISGAAYGVLQIGPSGASMMVSNAGYIGGGRVGVEAGSDATVTNSGTIAGYQGVALSSGSVTNTAGGTITGIGIASGTVINAGTITTGHGPTYDPVTMMNLYNSAATYGVFLTSDGSVVNQQTGYISGAIDGVFAAGTDATVENAGTITGTRAVYLDASSTNRLIVDAGATFVGGVLAGGGANTLELSGKYGPGSISGIGGQYRGFQNVTIDSGATWNIGDIYALGVAVDNAGSIGSTAGIGIYLRQGGAVTNESGGVISGSAYGVIVSEYGGTVDNSGTISGGLHSVLFTEAYPNRLIVHEGAVFNGNVYANSGGTNTLELASGAAGGVITSLGTQYANFQTVTIDANASWEIGGTKAGLDASTIQGFHTGDLLDITDVGFTTGDTATYSSGILTLYDTTHTSLGTIAMTGVGGDKVFDLLADDSGTGTFVEEDGVACYCRGTKILTKKGEVAVEDLKIGDRLITHWGAAKPIKWIGTRAYSGRFAAGNKAVMPVRISAGALGDNLPKRDLWVSPLHCMFIDGVLIPANALVNGTSITQATHVDKVEYFHLELETHDVIVAEGALSETFLDDDSRGMFHNAAEYRRLYPDAERKPADYCAPIMEEGAELEAIRARIAARADDERAGWAA